MNKTWMITLAAAMLAAAPTGIAGWAAYGDAEPSTFYDNPTLMFPDPPVEIGKPGKVYFNVFQSMYALGTNPNYADFGTRFEVVPIETPWAVLGVWKDCNGDGYIGMAEGALREYDAALLTDTSICPPSSGHIDVWDGSHNYNGWVVELIPIGNRAVSTTFNTRQILDPLAIIWGDPGEPNQPSTTAGGSCPINPVPRGTLNSTGGILAYGDCFAGGNGPFELINFATQENIRLAGQTIPGAPDPLGLRTQNDDNPRGHPVYDHPTFGREESEHSALRYSDCDATPLFDSGTFLNSTAPAASVPATQNVTIFAPDIRPGSTNPSVPGTVNATDEEIATLIFATPAGTVSAGGDCNYTNDREGAFYGAVEDDTAPTAPVGKRKAQYNFEYSSNTRGQRYNVSYSSVGLGGVARDLGLGDQLVVESPHRPGQAGLDDFGGQGVFPIFAAEWFGGTNLIKGAPRTVVTRLNIGDGEANPGPARAYWLSFYASVGPAVTDKYEMPGGSGKYGAAQCGANTEGRHNGWDCDPANWNLDAAGKPIPTGNKDRLAKVGEKYNLRDVDCYDGGTSFGVGAGVPFYGEENCDNPLG